MSQNRGFTRAFVAIVRFLIIMIYCRKIRTKPLCRNLEVVTIQRCCNWEVALYRENLGIWSMMIQGPYDLKFYLISVKFKLVPLISNFTPLIHIFRIIGRTPKAYNNNRIGVKDSVGWASELEKPLRALSNRSPPAFALFFFF